MKDNDLILEKVLVTFSVDYNYFDLYEATFKAAPRMFFLNAFLNWLCLL